MEAQYTVLKMYNSFNHVPGWIIQCYETKKETWAACKAAAEAEAEALREVHPEAKVEVSKGNKGVMIVDVTWDHHPRESDLYLNKPISISFICDEMDPNGQLRCGEPAVKG